MPRGGCAGCWRAMPLQPKLPSGKSRESQFSRLAGLQGRAEPVGVQMELACRVAADAPTKSIAFVGFDQAKLFGQDAICDGQGEDCFRRRLGTGRRQCQCERQRPQQPHAKASGQRRCRELETHDG